MEQVRTDGGHSHVGVPRAAEFVKPHLAATAMPLVTFSNAET